MRWPSRLIGGRWWWFSSPCLCCISPSSSSWSISRSIGPPIVNVVPGYSFLFFLLYSIFFILSHGLFLFEFLFLRLSILLFFASINLQDTPNGISGHTFFYTWVLSSVHFLMYYIRNIKLMTRGHLPRKVIILVDFAAFVLIFPSMVITYWHGHHSLKQMCFGAAIVRISFRYHDRRFHFESNPFFLSSPLCSAYQGALWNAILFFCLSKVDFLKFPAEAPRKVRSKSL